MRTVYGPPMVAPCPVCGYSIRVEKGGKLRQHGRRGGCPGSDTPASKARRQQPARDGTSVPGCAHRTRVQPQEALTGQRQGCNSGCSSLRYRTIHWNTRTRFDLPRERI